MARCDRCGSQCDPGPADSEYDYCRSCLDLFDAVRDSGVVVYWRNNEAGTQPPGYCVRSPSGDKMCGGQTEALAAAKDAMETYDVRGLFRYRDTGSRWLVDEYLDSHPGIAADVRRERMTIIQRAASRLPL